VSTIDGGHLGHQNQAVSAGSPNAYDGYPFGSEEFDDADYTIKNAASHEGAALFI
jgi:hypothetical protein